MTYVNIPLLRKVVEWVEQQDRLPQIDRQWNQFDYVMSADEMAEVLLTDSDGSIPALDNSLYSKYLDQVSGQCGTAYCVAGYIGAMMDDRYKDCSIANGVHVSDFAMEKLGISYEDSLWLFADNNSAQDIRHIAEIIAGEPL